MPIYKSEVLISSIIQTCFFLPVLGALADVSQASAAILFKFGSIHSNQRVFHITFGALLKQDIE